MASSNHEQPGRSRWLDVQDDSWSQRKGPIWLQMGLATFGILVLELTIIRWSAGQIRILAYFNNLVLIAAFLGMGLGVALGKRYAGLVHGTLPCLALVSVILACAAPLGLTHLHFPDVSIALWGGESAANGVGFLVALLLLLTGFWLIAAIFLCAGAAVGHLFTRTGTLRAYSFDLGGSLLGVLAFAGLTALGSDPFWWVLLGTLPFLYLSQKMRSVLGGAVAVGCAYLSVQGAVYSPYNRIEVVPDPPLGYTLGVNQDSHQFMYDLGVERSNSSDLPPQFVGYIDFLRNVYDIPFQLTSAKKRALIVGAGSGNDVQAALRNGFDEVWAVDIDPKIIALGKQLHPERPYDDPRVRPIVNDARAFFEQYEGEPFDAICYGFLDSHAMFSAMSSLRLENYVYTREGLNTAWEHVAPGGALTVCFSVYAGDWIANRLYGTLKAATGQTPIMIKHGMQHGCTFIVSRGQVQLDRLANFQRSTLPLTPAPLPQGERGRGEGEVVSITTDDWPFLYIKPGQFPAGYAALLFAIILTAAYAVRLTFGGRLYRSEFDLPMFLLGAAFLLVETRGVTQLSLLFGSTWVVNMAVFSGILLLALLANLVVERRQFHDARPWFIPLLLAVVITGAFNVSHLNEYSMVARGIGGGILNALPIGFAGIIVSIRLAQSPNPSASLGANLLGALVGGCLEYLSLWFGLTVLAGLAFLLYALALVAMRAKLRVP